MENNVPQSLVDQMVDRALRGRRETVADEVGRLVEATLVLIRRTGQLEPTVSDIVKQSGLHNQAFYRHFRSKHELLVAVLDQGIGLLASYLRHRMAGAATPEDEVREWLRGVLEQALNEDGAEATRPFVVARGRLAESYPDEVAESERQLTAPLRDALERARVARPALHAELLYLLAMGWVESRLADAKGASREDAAHLEAFAMRGLEGGG